MTVLGPQNPRFPIGLSDYAKLRRGGYTYVDKTALVAGVIDAPGEAKLIPRPRRFGKTLNMSMLRYFFERSDEDRSDLFEDTWIWAAEGGRFREHFQRYPVIYLTLKDVKGRTWDESWFSLRDLLRYELHRLSKSYDLRDIISSNRTDSEWFTGADSADAEPRALAGLLERLGRWLHQAVGEPAIILIDEYDATLHAAWEHGYWNEAIAFFRDFLSGGFKDASNLYRGVMTGILKVAKENIFSGLNNVRTYSLLDPRLNTDFGFTEAEVGQLAAQVDRTDELDKLRTWYNGYRFGGTDATTMYNPWSILMCLSTPGDAGFLSHWKNTSSNALVRDLLIRNARSVGPEVSALLTGETIETTIDDNVALNELDRSGEALWGLLTFSGYLTAETAMPGAEGYDVSLRIPNREVEAVFRTTFAQWLEAASGSGVTELCTAIVTGDAEAFEARLEDTLIHAMSTHDFGARPIEAIYQAFIVGLLVHMDARYRVTSNREAGLGRADVLIVPREPGGAGAVLELKIVGRRETPEQALDRAVEQIISRGYATEVREQGAAEVHQYGVVFDGKRCWVRMVE